MTYAAQVDGNQSEIVKGLRALGWSVEPIHRLGKGVPDLLIGAYGLNILMELKDPAQRPKLGKFEREHHGLNRAEDGWHRGWRGQVGIAETLAEVVAIVELNASLTGAKERDRRGDPTKHVFEYVCGSDGTVCGTCMWPRKLHPRVPRGTPRTA